MLFTHSVLFAAVFLAIALARFVRRGRSIRHIRGPPGFFSLLGHEYLMNNQERVGEMELQWFKQYGSTWRIQGAYGTDVLMTGDPKAMQYIYHKRASNFPKKPSQNHMSYLLGGPSIVSDEGDAHLRHRKNMNPAFSAAHLRSFLPLFQRITAKLVGMWKAELAAAPEADSNVNNWLSRTTLDIVGQAAFEYDYGALDENDQSPISKAYHGILQDAQFQQPKAVFLFRALWDHLPEPLLRMFQYLPVHPFPRMLNLRRLFSEYGKKILKDKNPEVDTERQTNSKDILTILVKASKAADAKMRLSDEEIMADMYMLTLAGHETTASTFTFLLYELAQHPEYQRRMRDEIREARARLTARGGVDFTMEDLNNMPVCMNAIKETLRHHPILTYLPRLAAKDDIIPLAHPIVTTTGETITEIPISKGQAIITDFGVYNHLPQVWGDDADQWNPDRFLRIDNGKQTNVGVFANLMTFSAGIRACIGWRFSIIEMQALCTEILETFQLQLPGGKEGLDDPETSEIQLVPAGGTRIPILRGRPELGPHLRLRVSLVKPE
ncbi:PAH-inducible cytochrome P450 monooxygenase PC-PAH 4 [Trametes polyzona]|nr:PAH-inducible cytochrome P450 monooxygenase PC-PAH 4 [Trametes polyzona]